MTKTGKPDSYWHDIMLKYAQGKYHFTTGKKPGAKKWKTALETINNCPLHRQTRVYDIFGKRIPCKCGYHKSAEQTALGMQAGPLSSAGVQAGPVSSAGSNPTPQSSAGFMPAPQSSAGFIPTPQFSAGSSPALQISAGSRPAHQISAGSRPAHQISACSSPALQISAGSSPALQISAGSSPAPQRSAGSSPAPQRSAGSSSALQRSAGSSPAPHISACSRPAPQISSASRPQISAGSSPQISAGSRPDPQSSNLIKCSLCKKDVVVEGFTEHLSDYHVQECCDQCGAKVLGAVGLLHHIENHHPLTSLSDQDQQSVNPPATSTAQSPAYIVEQQGAPHTSLHTSSMRPPEVNWVSFLPKQFCRVIKPADQKWIAQCLYDSTGRLKQQFSQNWFHPPSPSKPTTTPPDPGNYFRQRMFLWGPMRMWGIPLKCTACNTKMHHSGIYTKVREVIDVDSRYYLIGADYPRCSKCMIPVCPWSSEILKQLDPSHRNKFPAVLTTHLALDRKCVTLLKPRTAGNSSSYLQQALEEIHSEEWARRTIDYLTDCEFYKKRCALTQLEVVYEQPPPFCPLPLAQWFETAHANEILSHHDELKGVITSTYGSILKLDSTKKITKKLAGGIADTATWMTNVGNEFGQVLNCVLTTGEGAALHDLCQGIVKRYKDAGEPEPAVIYVDRDCCSKTGVTPVLTWFRPWKITVRLDVFHFMRRFTAGLTTEHHPLYGTFCSKLSSCIFEWDKDDISRLKEAKKTMHGGHIQTEAQILSSITSSELAKHCRRRTRGVEETRALIQGLLDSMWELTDTTGLRLVNPESMTRVWEVQQKHLPCIQDPPAVQLYTKLGAGLQKGDKVLDVLRCGRGSSSLESFHRHQCTFIPGWRCNALHTQMYMLEGASRWNINRAHQAVDISGASHTKMYDARLMSHLNILSNRVLGCALLPEFTPPGKPTDERIAVEYLLAQSDRGDLLSPLEHGEVGITLPEMQVEVQEDECLDVTICDAADISLDTHTLGRSSSHDSLSSSLEASVPIVGSCSPDVEDIFCAEPSTSALDSRCDSRGVPGWEAVDNLAGFLVSLNRTITALSTNEIAEILRLYSCLQAIDQSSSKYSLKCKKKILEGPWRASRKRSGSAPGQQAAERLFMIHGQAAQRPDVNRIAECVALKLLKEFKEARNRPRDNKGKVFPIPQAIVMTYSHIKQLLEDCREILEKTNLVLVTINNTTVSSWLLDRQQRTGRDTLLQGVPFHQHVGLANEPLPKPRELPSAPVQHGHVAIEFQEPENRDGEGVIRQRKYARTGTAMSSITHTELGLGDTSHTPAAHRGAQQLPGWHTWPGYPDWSFPPYPPHHGLSSYPPSAPPMPQGWSSLPPGQQPSAPLPSPQHSQGWSSLPPGQLPSAPLPPPQHSQGWSSFPPGQQPSAPSPHSQGWFSFPPGQQPSAPPPHSQEWSSLPPGQQPSAPPPHQNRQRAWRMHKAALADQESLARGEPPKKRHTKEHYHYQCKACGHSKSKLTGHSQVKGKWYCPASGQTITEWKDSL